MFSTVGNAVSKLRGYHDECEGYQRVSSTLGDTITTLGDTMMSVEGIMSTVGVFSTLRDTVSTLIP